MVGLSTELYALIVLFSPPSRCVHTGQTILVWGGQLGAAPRLQTKLYTHTHTKPWAKYVSFSQFVSSLSLSLLCVCVCAPTAPRPIHHIAKSMLGELMVQV